MEKTPTADLIAEIGVMNMVGNPCAYMTHEWHEWESKKFAIKDELDRRTNGINIINGLPEFTEFDDYEIPEPEKDYMPHLESAIIRIPVAELIDRLRWLLMKEGGVG
jgi:hypothetical protein